MLKNQIEAAILRNVKKNPHRESMFLNITGASLHLSDTLLHFEKIHFEVTSQDHS